MTEYTTLDNATFLDLASYRTNLTAAPEGTLATGHHVFNVALILERANDHTTLLNADWASRHKQIDALTKSGSLWSTYGANPTNYADAVKALGELGISTVEEPNGYIASAELRTIWVRIEVDHSKHVDQFEDLFNTPLLKSTDTNIVDGLLWADNLSLPTTLVNLGVEGIWFDGADFNQAAASPGGGIQLKSGPQSEGNSGSSVNVPPNEVAEIYNFPLTGDLWNPLSSKVVQTGTIGLIEPKMGLAIPGPIPSFQAGLDTYRYETINLATPATVLGVSPGGEVAEASGERSLDAGIVTAINPQSPLVVYAGSGTAFDARSEEFSVYQSAIWADTGDPFVAPPEVVSSSWGMQYQQPAAGSPFLWAAQQLFVDAALQNMTILTANSDGGSGDQYGNGATNVETPQTSPYELMVGGTSQSSLDVARTDSTLTHLVNKALAQDRATLWQLIAGGLTEMPSLSNPLAWLVETVWNEYETLQGVPEFVSGDSYLENNASTGGVDPTQPVPWYQEAFGLTPRTSDPEHLVGRGVPDVAGPAAGNLFFLVPTDDMVGTEGNGGTSAATPFWASLISQINAVFKNQGLPHLGYMNDLLYIAAAIAPASFNDITIGENTSSYTMGGADYGGIAPTGYGYKATEGYDLTTGLGSPNGIVLARALSAIGHSQMSFSDLPDVLDSQGKSATAQTLLIQTMSHKDAPVLVDFTGGSHSLSFTSEAPAPFAATSGFAQQSVQPQFDAALVVLFDAQAQGTVAQATLTTGDGVAVSIDGHSAEAVTARLTNPFGFVDYELRGEPDSPVVRLARPVAVAETAGGADDQEAIVRIRQDGTDSVSLSFYRVDDLNGTIGVLNPGDAGYAAAAQARAYQVASGGSSITGPGYGQSAQASLLDVDAGDIIAMQLINITQGNALWAFSQANEMVDDQHVGHIWNYGLNTWGFEDTFGGGDRDYNDLIVGLDFTSAAGHGWLVGT